MSSSARFETHIAFNQLLAKINHFQYLISAAWKRTFITSNKWIWFHQWNFQFCYKLTLFWSQDGAWQKHAYGARDQHIDQFLGFTIFLRYPVKNPSAILWHDVTSFPFSMWQNSNSHFNASHIWFKSEIGDDVMIFPPIDATFRIWSPANQLVIWRTACSRLDFDLLKTDWYDPRKWKRIEFQFM